MWFLQLHLQLMKRIQAIKMVKMTTLTEEVTGKSLSNAMMTSASSRSCMNREFLSPFLDILYH